MTTSAKRLATPRAPDRPAQAAAAPSPIGRAAFGELVRPVRGRLWLGGTLALLSSVLGLLPFVAVAEIARHLLGGSPTDAGVVWTWVALGAAGVAGRLLLMFTASMVTHYADADLQRHLRTRLARHMATVPLGWFDGRGSGELKKAVDDDVEAMHHLVAHARNDMLGAAGLPIAAVVYLLAVDWRMALVTLTLLPVSMLLMVRGHRTLPERMARLESANRRINNATVEYVDGIQIIKAFGQAGRAYQRFARAVDDFCDGLASWQRDAATMMFANLMLLSPATVLLVVLSAGTAFVAAGWLPAVDLLPFLLVGVGLTTPYMTLVSGTQELRRARAAATHVQQVLAVPPLPEPAEPKLPATHGIQFDGVRFGYDEHTEVLHGIDLTCTPGTVTALVGPSGSGKTTITRLIPRFYDVTAGAVRLGGVDVREIPSRELLGRVAIVFQDVVLLRDTVQENIRLGRPDATDAEVEAAARAARIHERILTLPAGYGTVLDQHAGGLSGGERQRVTIARAILQDAPVVVLDEATAYADPENEAAVQDAIAELTAGRTLVVIAHRLHTITGADQIVVLDQGRVVERGRHAELLTAGGLYARLWEAQEQARKTSEAQAPHQEVSQ